MKALLVPFAAGFVVQRFLEILDPWTTDGIKNPQIKQAVMGTVSLILGTTMAGIGQLGIFHLLDTASKFPDWFDYFLTGVFISAGTEGFNSLMKFASYKKEASKADAANKLAAAGNAPKNLNP